MGVSLVSRGGARDSNGGEEFPKAFSVSARKDKGGKQVGKE